MTRSSGSSSPVKVALFLPSLEGGGAERVFVELANQFVEEGLEVDLVLASAQGPYLEEVSAAVRVVDLNARGVLNALPRLIRYLRDQRPRALLSALNHANVVAVFAALLSGSKTRSVISVRSLPSVVHAEMGSRHSCLLLQLMKLAYPLADAIVANSEAVASDLAGLLKARDRVPLVFYNPLNLDRIEELSRREVCELEIDGGPLILGVGSLTILKDFETLIRAFALVRAGRRCRLAILGEGPERGCLERLVAELGLTADVLLPGFVSNPFSWMRNAAVFVSSSVTEGCPNALMQALACGTPLVSTDCAGGSAEILQHGKWGRLVPTKERHGDGEGHRDGYGLSESTRCASEGERVRSRPGRAAIPERLATRRGAGSDRSLERCVGS